MSAPFKSEFALLDVTAGRRVLERRVLKGSKVKVLIEGEIDDVWGGDDGTSLEFCVTVTKVEERP